MFKGLFNKKRKDLETEPPYVLPAALLQEDPVNYNSVLDYLVGLSKTDFARIFKSATIYRDANAKVAKLLGIKDEPTTTIVPDKAEVTDADLDKMLAADKGELIDALVETNSATKPEAKKQQAPSKSKKATTDKK